MVRRAEGPGADERDIRRQLVGDGVDAGHIQGFVDGHARQDGGQRAGQQGLARARRANHQHIMHPGGRDFEGALDVLLAFDFAEIGRDRRLPHPG